MPALGGRIIRILNARGKGEFHGLKDAFHGLKDAFHGLKNGCHGLLPAWTSRRVTQKNSVLAVTLHHLAGSLAGR